MTLLSLLLFSLSLSLPLSVPISYLPPKWVEREWASSSSLIIISVLFVILPVPILSYFLPLLFFLTLLDRDGYEEELDRLSISYFLLMSPVVGG